MSDLAAFYAARLDEDEAYLRTMAEIGKRKADEATPQDEADAWSFAMTMLDDPAARQVIEQWSASAVPPPNDNARMLREIEAGRAILAEYERYDGTWAYLSGLGFAIAHRAAVYDSHPDYRQEWKP
jgi:hypothetical protein